VSSRHVEHRRALSRKPRDPGKRRPGISDHTASPEAGWSAVLHLPRLKTEEELVLELLSEQQVLVQPGWFYDFATEPYVIVSLLTEPAVLREGIERLVAYVLRIAG